MVKKISQALITCEKLLVVLPFALLCLLIVSDIIMRNCFDTGLPWLEELSRYILIVGTFMGASIAISGHEHPRMEAVLIALPFKARQIALICGSLLCAVTMALLDYYAVKQVLHLYHIGTHASNLPLSLWMVYLIFPISIFAMCLRFIFDAAASWQKLRHGKTEEVA
ncbi:MAG: TRAP transporter small permease [Bacillota bacterium]|nr:TRAP transporter small permease [Bacillota bacterium]